MAKMPLIRVLIATTRGPVEIQNIAQENPSVRSVICVGGAFTALPISPAYDAFVREPTGVVERMTGHPVYRTDVAAPIEAGESWQLGLFLAHAFHLSGALAKHGELADKTILVTGGLDRNLNVTPVLHIDRKLAQADIPARGDIIFLYPQSAEPDEYADGRTCLAVSDAREALEICLGQQVAERLLPQKPSPLRQKLPSMRGRLISFARAATVSIVLLLVGYAVFVFWESSTGEQGQNTDGKAAGFIDLSVAPRDPDSGKCDHPVQLSRDIDIFVGPLCFGRLSVSGRGEYRIRMMIDGAFSGYVDQSRYRREIQRTTDGDGRLVLQIDFPYWVTETVWLTAEAELLGMDGNPVRSAKRILKVPFGDRGSD